jgi:hypothetical protein
MSSTESNFREIERQLDLAVADAIGCLGELGIRVMDKSLRKYQGRVDYLLWQYDFEKDWELDLETARVRVSVSFGEPVDRADAAQVRVWSCAEQFRPGQVSHVRETFETIIPVEAVIESQLADVVVASVRKGGHVLGRTL